MPLSWFNEIICLKVTMEIKNKAVFNYRESLKLWENGYSYADLSNKYGYCIPQRFSQETYDATIAKFKDVFKRVEAKDYYVNCPHADTWECNNCDYEECPNPIEYIEVGPDEPYSSHCKHKIKQDPDTKKKTVPAFRRNGKIYCKSEACTQAVIDAWEYITEVKEQ